jgi:hypothetical protein
VRIISNKFFHGTAGHPVAVPYLSVKESNLGDVSTAKRIVLANSSLRLPCRTLNVVFCLSSQFARFTAEAEQTVPYESSSVPFVLLVPAVSRCGGEAVHGKFGD